MQLHFQRHGNGFPLVILHGLFGSSENWQPLARRFAAQFTVLTVDLRNHGRSPHNDLMDYPAMAGDLARLFEAQQLRSVHLLGHSLGGKLAMQFALAFPDRVAKLIVVDIAPKAYPPKHDHVFEALLALDLKRYHRRREIDEALAPAIPDRALRQFLLKNLAHDADGAFRWKINLRAMSGSAGALRHPPPAPGPFAGPVLFLRGGTSDYVEASDIGLIRHRFPTARIATIEGAGHWVHAEAPDEFLRECLAFLQE